MKIACRFCGFVFAMKKLPARAPHHYTHQATLCGAGGIMINRCASPPKIDKPDLRRCQAEITVSNPWAIGGVARKTSRCTNTPVVIAIQRKPGKDGRCGAMSLCDGCLGQFRRQMPADFAKFGLCKAPEEKRKRGTRG